MITEIKKGDQFVCVLNMMGPNSAYFKIGGVYRASSDTAIEFDGGSCGGWDITNINQHFIPYTYAAIWEQYKAAKTMEDAEPWVKLLHGLEVKMGHSTKRGGNYKTQFDPNDPDLEHEAFKQDLEAKEANASIAPDDLPSYYDNSKGSLYKIAQDRGWASYVFDVVKRLDRGGKKDPLEQEIRKSIGVLQLWLKEMEADNV